MIPLQMAKPKPKDKRKARSIRDKRSKKKRGKKFSGRKEKLREEVKILQADKDKYLETNSRLLQQNQCLKR